MKNKKLKIYLCDFVHNYSGTGTYMFPLNIGFIAAYANKLYADKVEIKLFKFPQNFLDAFNKEKADIVGFSNYIWSSDINSKISDYIKEKSPETITVFGGPDINCSESGYLKFFNSHKNVDFYVIYQGEVSFANLLEEIINKNKDINKIKSKQIDGVVSSAKGKIFQGKPLPRIKNPDDIPSPYLTGLFDEFFDTKLIPLVETNRGCPYSCTFCAQGFSSFHQMEFFSLERVKKELDYIANHVKNTNLIMFTDSNFGIVERDMEIARYLMKLKEEKGYPRKFNANWAKNQPKIFEIAKIMDNINLIISLQSLDEKVLKNIKRQNIEISVFKNIIEKINEAGAISGTEVILGLPGETKESHLKTLRTLFDWDVSYIICYLAMLLDGSELSLIKENNQFKCKTKFRYVDNAFGRYNNIMSIESEEGIRSTDTMSEQEMLSIRPIHWLIQFLWNYRFAYPLLKYMQSLKINPLDCIAKMADNLDNKNTPEKVKIVFNGFREDANTEWFNSKQELQQHFFKPENFKALEEGKYGKLNGKYIFRMLLEAKEDFEKYSSDIAANFSDLTKEKKEIIGDISRFIEASTINFNQDWENISKERIISLKYDVLGWINSKYRKNLESFYAKQGIKLKFYIPEEQKKALDILLKQYAHKNKNVTLRKMSEFMDVRDFFRKAKLVKMEEIKNVQK